MDRNHRKLEPNRPIRLSQKIEFIMWIIMMVTLISVLTYVMSTLYEVRLPGF